MGLDPLRRPPEPDPLPLRVDVINGWPLNRIPELRPLHLCYFDLHYIAVWSDRRYFNDVALQLREHLLSSSEGRPWKLVYSSAVHGYSINTLYRSMAKSDLVTLLVIADMDEKVTLSMHGWTVDCLRVGC